MRIPKEITEHINQLYKQGVTISEIAKQIGLTPSVVCGHIIEDGIKRKTTYSRHNTKSNQKIAINSLTETDIEMIVELKKKL